MFELVNDVEAYPRRFAWCEGSQVIERARTVVAKLGLASVVPPGSRPRTHPPLRIDMHLREGPFQLRAAGSSARWTNRPANELTLDCEPRSPAAGAIDLGLQRLADRMVDDFIRVADDGGAARVIEVEVVLALPRESRRCGCVPEGSTAEVAQASGLPQEGISGYAVFGERVAPGARLRNGDRLELLRPLVLDPKEARRRRAARAGR